MRTTCRACDQGRHGDCDGSALYMDQDGPNHYVCECYCRRQILADQRKRQDEADVRRFMRERGMDRTHDLVERKATS